MLKLLLPILMLLLSISSNGQRKEYVSTTKESFITNFNLPLVRGEISNLLYSEKCILAYAVANSFFVGQKFSILKKENQYMLLLEYKPLNSIPLRRPRPAKIDSTIVSEKFVLLLQEVFAEEFKTKISHSKKTGFDGAYYYFFTRRKLDKDLCAESWSPGKESSTRQVADLCRMIITKAKKRNNFPEKEVMIKMEAILR